MSTAAQHGGLLRERRSAIQMLGGLCLVGGVCYAISGVRFTLAPEQYDNWTAVLALVWCAGCLCGLAGMVLLGVAGTRAAAWLAFVLPFIGVAGTTLAWLINVGTPQLAEESPVLLLARLATMAGFLILGITTLVVRSWGGWRNGAPLFYLAAIGVGLATSLLANVETTVLAIGVAWIVIGYAVWSAADRG